MWQARVRFDEGEERGYKPDGVCLRVRMLRAVPGTVAAVRARTGFGVGVVAGATMSQAAVFFVVSPPPFVDAAGDGIGVVAFGNLAAARADVVAKDIGEGAFAG